MRCVSCLLFACFLMGLTLSFPRASEAAEAETASQVTAEAAAGAVSDFAVDVYRELAKESGNIFFSPYSVSSAMAMAYAGAKGDTAAKMEKVLRFTEYGPGIHESMKSLRERFESIPAEEGTLDAANRLWLDKEEKFTTDYRLLTMENYAAGVEQADFLNAGESERVKINGWVEQNTGGKIKNLLEEGSVTKETKLMLVNAVYFKSDWAMPFQKRLTAEAPFRSGKERSRNVPMMRNSANYMYGEDAEAQWIKIPYKTKGLSMMIILPKENESFTQLEELENKLTSRVLDSWASSMKRSLVALSMPKFKDERGYSLKDTLDKLGMKLAFTEDADFSGMVEEPVKNGYALHIDFVAHKAFIELDEERTEAAAATAVGMIRATSIGLEPKPVEFNADHPFIYCLTDDVTGAILFMGRMVEP